MTAATAPVTAAQPARASWSRSLLGTVISLIATTRVTSVLGVAFWWLAAHRASLGTVGNGSAAVSALSLVATAALLRRRGVRLLARPQWAMLRGIGRASMHNTWLNNALQAPSLIGPILVTGLLGAEPSTLPTRSWGSPWRCSPACARWASTPCPRCGPPSGAAGGPQPGTKA